MQSIPWVGDVGKLHIWQCKNSFVKRYTLSLTFVAYQIIVCMRISQWDRFIQNLCWCQGKPSVNGLVLHLAQKHQRFLECSWTAPYRKAHWKVQNSSFTGCLWSLCVVVLIVCALMETDASECFVEEVKGVSTVHVLYRGEFIRTG